MGSVLADRPRPPRRVRFDALAGIAAFAFVVLFGRMVQVQIVASSGYREIATGNRIRTIETPAPRGRIIDVDGRVLADTRSSYAVTLDWVGLSELDEDQRRTVFLELGDELRADGRSIEPDHLEEVFRRARRQALEPVVVADDVAVSTWIALSELGLPGIEVAAVPIRTYPAGEVAAHVVGYLGSVVDNAEADRLNRVDPDHGYRPGHRIGRSGLEQLFERQLRGIPEIRRVEVDSANRVVRTVVVVQESRPGRDIHLELDLDLQLLAERALIDEMDRLRRADPGAAPAASFVVLDPRDGAVRALASWPAFDPSIFVDGLDTEEAERLFADPSEPFVNRAIDGQYPAGSTFKPVTALAAIGAGLRAPDDIWEDSGVYELVSCLGSGGAGCRFRNARGAVLGPVDLRRALTLSSDTYFYSLGERLWLERARLGDDALQRSAASLGFGAPSGIELPGEASGRLPTPAARQASHDRYPEAFPDPRWYTGDNVNLAIGQGELLVTPIQLANLYATLASGGVRHQPRLVDAVAERDTGATVLEFGTRTVGGEPIDAAVLEPIVEGLAQVASRGTAAQAFAGFPLDRFPLATKTGTAEVLGRTDFALFAGFGPLDGPRLAFAVVIEEAGFGGEAAAPVARRFLDGVLALEDDPTGAGSSTG
jgi:penicillin-binding protein 2